MSKPNNSISKIKLPGENTGRPIVPYYVGVSSSNNFVATLPDTLTADAEFIINKLNQVISGEKTFNDGIKIGSDSPGASNAIALYNQDTFGYDYLYGGTDGGDYQCPSFSGDLGVAGDLFVDGGHIKRLDGSLYTYTLPDASGTIAITDDIPTNIQNGSTTGSLQQVFDGSTFTFVNPNSPLNNTTVNIGVATGTYATMLGGKGRVEGKRGFVNGTQVVATGAYSHAEGNNTHANAANSHAEGIQTYANGSASHAEGSSTAATEIGAHSEGYGTHADGVYTHTEGSTNYALGDNSHAEGGSNIIGVYSGPSPTPTPGPAPEPGTAVHAEGMGSHAEGNNNTITGAYSHAEGQSNTISSNRAHAEGNSNTVSGLYAHAEGNGGVASGEGAHSEGLYGHAIGNYSHAEGAATYANGLYSHAAGQDSTANGTASFASGYHVTANRDYQTVLGKYNLGQADTLLEVGKGTADNARSNAFEVHKDGHATVGAMGATDLSVATKQYVDNNNTKNTAGSTNDTSKLFLVGAKTQATYNTTYSRNNTYILGNGILVNTTGFSSYDYASTSAGLLSIGVNLLQYTSGSGPASLSVTSPTHGSFKLGETSGTSIGDPHNIYLQKTAGSAYTGAAYLLFPNVGTSSAPKTLATTDNFSASSSAVSGATEAKSIQINGTNWNLPSGGGATVVSAEFVQAGYSGNLIASPTASTQPGLPLYIKFGSAPTSNDDYDAELSGIKNATILGNTSFSTQEIVYVWTDDGAGIMATPNIIYNGQTFSTSAGKYHTYIYSNPIVIELTVNGDITMQTYYVSGGGSD